MVGFNYVIVEPVDLSELCGAIEQSIGEIEGCGQWDEKYIAYLPTTEC